MKNRKTNFAYTTYIVKVKMPGNRRWGYYKGVEINDTVIASLDFFNAFRFHDRKAAELVAKSLETLGVQTQINEV